MNTKKSMAAVPPTVGKKKPSLSFHDLEDMESPRPPSVFPLGSLPESCLSEVMTHLSPDDVSRLSCVSHLFASAASSHTVWQAVLPAHHQGFQKMLPLSRPSPSLSSFPNPSPPSVTHSSANRTRLDLYRALRRGVYLSKGRQHVAVKRGTGALRVSVSVAQAMDITWNRHRGRPQYWAKAPAFGRTMAPFVRAGHLAVLHWKKISCEANVFLPPGRYSVMWCIGREFLSDDNVEDEGDQYEIDTCSPLNSPPVSPSSYSPGWESSSCGSGENRTNGRSPRGGRMGIPFICLEVAAKSKVAVNGGKAVVADVPISQRSLKVVPDWTEVKVAEISVEAKGGAASAGELCCVQIAAELGDTPRRHVAVYADCLVFELLPGK